MTFIAIYDKMREKIYILKPLKIIVDNPTIKSCQYICNYCSVKRSVHIYKEIHLNRQDLTEQGLATYVDVHENDKKLEKGEHGVRLFIDANFSVRSNTPILETKIQEESFTPRPVIKLFPTVYKFNMRIFKFLKIESPNHMVSITIENPFNKFENSEVLNITSPFNTVTLTAKYNLRNDSQEAIENLEKWSTMLVKWIEHTGRIQSIFLPSIINLIDANYDKEPMPVDELSISVLLDAHTTIYLNNQEDSLSAYFINKSDNNEATQGEGFTQNEKHVINTISSQLKNRKIIDLKTLSNEVLKDTESAQKMKKITILVTILDFLIKEDYIGYHVSYLQ